MRMYNHPAFFILSVGVLLLAACTGSDGGGSGDGSSSGTGGSASGGGSGSGRVRQLSPPPPGSSPTAPSADLSATWAGMPAPGDLFVVSKPGDIDQILDYEVTYTPAGGEPVLDDFSLTFGKATNSDGVEVFRVQVDEDSYDDYVVSDGWVWFDFDSTNANPEWLAQSPVDVQAGDWWIFREVPGVFKEEVTCLSTNATAPNGIAGCVHFEVLFTEGDLSQVVQQYFKAGRWYVYMDIDSDDPEGDSHEIIDQTGTRPLANE